MKRIKMQGAISVRKCKYCKKPLPKGTRPNKLYCNNVCRKAEWDKVNREHKLVYDRAYSKKRRDEMKEKK